MWYDLFHRKDSAKIINRVSNIACIEPASWGNKVWRWLAWSSKCDSRSYGKFFWASIPQSHSLRSCEFIWLGKPLKHHDMTISSGHNAAQALADSEAEKGWFVKFKHHLIKIDTLLRRLLTPSFLLISQNNNCLLPHYYLITLSCGFHVTTPIILNVLLLLSKSRFH